MIPIFTDRKSVLFLFGVILSHVLRFPSFFSSLHFFSSTIRDSCILAFKLVSLYWVVTHLQAFIPLHSVLPPSILLKAQLFQLSLILMEDIFLFCKQAERSSKDHRRHLSLFLTTDWTSENTEHGKKVSLHRSIFHTSSNSQNLSWMGIFKSISKKCIQDCLSFGSESFLRTWFLDQKEGKKNPMRVGWKTCFWRWKMNSMEY